MTDSANVETFAARQRRKYRHAEWREQIRLTELLMRYLPDNVFWSALSNAPRTALGGYLAKKRGVRSGLADIMVVHDGRVTFVELKSPVGVASKAQRQVYLELRAAGADWYLVKSAPAALEALRRSNVPFRRCWKAAAARGLGGTIRQPAPAAAAAPRGSGAAEGGAASLARASTRPQSREVGSGARQCPGR
jgi:hypothetical protein